VNDLNRNAVGFINNSPKVTAEMDVLLSKLNFLAELEQILKPSYIALSIMANFDH